jgi:hypothetical protein
VHDLFDILGVSHDARAADIRRACQGRVAATHPDVAGGPLAAAPAFEPSGPDAAVDFANMTSVVERMRAAFFAD